MECKFFEVCENYTFCPIQININIINNKKEVRPCYSFKDETRIKKSLEIITLENYKKFWNANHWGGNAYCILTGCKSSCSVIDFDDKSIYDSFIENNPNATNNCLVIETKRGYHIYYAYTPDLITKTNCFKNYEHVDIRNDGGIIVGPHSFYTIDNVKYEYKIIQECDDYELPPIPNEVLDEINEDCFKSNKKQSFSTERTLASTEEIEIFYQYAELIDTKGYDEYFTLMCCHKNIIGEKDIDRLFNLLSKYGTPDENTYDSLQEGHGYGWPTLVKLAKKFDTTRTETIENKQRQNYLNRKRNESLLKLSDISPRDLAKEFDEYKPTIINEQFLKIPPFHDTLVVISPCGSGKTHGTNTWLRHLGEDRCVVAITSRITLANKLQNDFEFKNYKQMSDSRNISLKKNRRIIISVESFWKLTIDVDDYILLLDEAGTIFTQLVSPTINKAHNDKVIANIKKVFKGASHCLCLDASFRVSDMKLLQAWRPNRRIDVLINEYVNDYVDSSVVKVSDKKDWFIHNLMLTINNGNKIVIPCCTNNRYGAGTFGGGKFWMELISSEYPTKKIALFSSDSKKKVNWEEQDVVIYTSSIDRGVSFDIPDYFDCHFCDFGFSDSVNSDTCFQLMRRVRRTNDKLYFVLLPKITQTCKDKPDMSIEILDYRITQKHFIKEAISRFDSKDNYFSCFSESIEKTCIKNTFTYPHKDCYYDTWLSVLHRKWNQHCLFIHDFIQNLLTDGFNVEDHFSEKKSHEYISFIENANTKLELHRQESFNEKVLFLQNLYDNDINEFNQVLNSVDRRSSPELTIICTFLNTFHIEPKFLLGNFIPCERLNLRYQQQLLNFLNAYSKNTDITPEAIHDCKNYMENSNKKIIKTVFKDNELNLKVCLTNKLLESFGFNDGIKSSNSVDKLIRSEWLLENYQLLDQIWLKEHPTTNMVDMKPHVFNKWLNGKLEFLGLSIHTERTGDGHINKSYSIDISTPNHSMINALYTAGYFNNSDCEIFKPLLNGLVKGGTRPGGINSV